MIYEIQGFEVFWVFFKLKKKFFKKNYRIKISNKKFKAQYLKVKLLQTKYAVIKIQIYMNK